VKRAKRHPPPVPKVRNPVARAPILGKGGPHGKSTRAKRRQANVEARKLARDPHAQD
jgi:hypothetical protein